MGIRFYFGTADGDLSQKVYRDTIQRSLEHPEQNYLVVVPDQFTMQTQKELALLHPRGGILNIDVLSFGRLGHRILAEVGCKEVPVLDDTGKSLVLQKITEKMSDELPVIGGFLHKQGYIHEVKSAISEFMQYGIAPADLEELIAYSGEKRLLAGKLKDLGVIYDRFQNYIQDHFVTAEETLDILRRNLVKSNLLKGSVVILDGFTGFTPIQYRLLQEMATLCEEMIITLVCGEETSPYRLEGEQKLFYLTQKTVHDLEKMAAEANIDRDRREDVFLRDAAEQAANAAEQAADAAEHVADAAGRVAEQPQGMLAFLQAHLFRYDGKTYPLPEALKGEVIHSDQAKQALQNGEIFIGEMTHPASGRHALQHGEISIREMTNPAQEAHQTAIEIQRLLRKGKLAYRDIALICGDLEGYAPYVESAFAKMDIPFFVDRTRGITLNPLTEFMMSALRLSLKNYSYEAVFHYLRSGMTDIAADEIDRLENYVLAVGIRGKKAWQNRFVKRKKGMDPEDEGELEALNATREKFMLSVEMITGKKRDKASNYVERLYDFLIQADCQRKLEQQAKWFEEQGDGARAKEYSQIYRLVMELLNQIYQILGEESVNLEEFIDILTAGLGEIQVGTIPQKVDRVLVGDMERTRFKPVKVLFFLGVNDGNIPRNASKGGIISDMEREFLQGSEHELAPTPRQQMFIQRFYLYLNFTKPSEALYLSFSRQGSDGKALRPAYLIDSLKKLFPGITVEYPQNLPVLEQIVTLKSAREYLAAGMRDYAEGLLDELTSKDFLALYSLFSEGDLGKTRKLYEQAAFERYQDLPLSKEVSGLLYGTVLENSVSRLETFSSCAYKHFLQYGLSLQKRQEYEFERSDLGTVYHSVLETFSHTLEEAGQSWISFDEAFAREHLADIIEKKAAEYSESVLYASNRSAYQITRMERVLLRTVFALQKQLQKGTFTPKDYEAPFRQSISLWDEMDGEKLSQGEQESGISMLNDAGASEKQAEKNADGMGACEAQAGINVDDAGADKKKVDSNRNYMRVSGRIDRIDTDEDSGNIYVKVLDYKSGENDVDLVSLYQGLQLQLAVYMNAAMEKESKLARNEGKKVIPAAMLYYHVDDPLLESKEDMTQEEADAALLKKLCVKGLVNDSADVVNRLDQSFEGSSDVIPVGRKNDGSYTAHSSVISQDDLEMISSFVDRKLVSIGREILDGKITLNPYERGKENACKYCPYAKVCGFDRSLPGCKTRKIEEHSDKEMLELMRKTKEEGRQDGMVTMRSTEENGRQDGMVTMRSVEEDGRQDGMERMHNAELNGGMGLAQDGNGEE